MASKGLRALTKHYQTPFFKTAYSLIAAQISTSLLGYLFWMIVTRLFNPNQVGIATAIFSASMLMTGLAGIGLDEGLWYFLPRVQKSERLISASFSLTVLAGFILPLIFIAGLKLWSPHLALILQEPTASVLFVAGNLLLVVSAMQDGLFIAERKANMTLIKGIFVNLLRFPLLFLFLKLSIWSLLLSAALAGLAGTIVFTYFYRKYIRAGYRFRPELHTEVLKPVIGYSSGNFITNQLFNLPITLLPLLILRQLGAAANAYFYVGWMLASMTNVIGRSFGVSLVVESGQEPGSDGRNTHRALAISTVVLLPAVITLSLLARPLLLVFGRDYSTESTALVILLAISSIPLTYQGIAVGVLKAHAKIGALLVTGVVFTGLHLAGSAWLAPTWGLAGVGIGVTLARTCSAALAFLLAFRTRLPMSLTRTLHHKGLNQ